LTDPLQRIGNHLVFIAADVEYSTSEIMKIIKDCAIREHDNVDNVDYETTFGSIYRKVQKEILASTPTYRKALIARAADPNSELTLEDQDILKVIYEMGY
jgi:hypothetical protein